MIQQKFKPNRDLLKIVDIEINTENVEPKYVKHSAETREVLPSVYYYKTELPSTSIKKLEIDSNGFLPMCEITFDDTFGIMHDIGFPTDNAKLTIILPTNHKNFAPIFMEFKITHFQVEIIRNSTAKRIHMWGICNIENILIKEYKSYPDTTSYDMIYKVAQETGMGLMSNLDSSADNMTWINPGWNVYNFLQDTIYKSWVGETSYIWGFVDLYYNMNYIDLEKSLSQDMNEITWISASTIDNKNQNISSDQTTAEKIVGPILSNDPGLKSSNSYFTAEKIINQSTDISLKRGYLRDIHYYDVDGNWENKAGSYKQYTLDTITTSGGDETTIFLKGEENDLDFYNKNKGYIYMDRIDTKNMHPDYLWAKVQNQENLYDLQKITMQITIPTPNFNIRRFEKIKLLFINENVGATGTPKNVKLNGEWLVTGISFKWNGRAFYQVVNIVKRELTVDEI